MRRGRPLVGASLLLLLAGDAHARLPGKTVDVPFDAARVTQHVEESYTARLYLPPQAQGSAQPLPLVVFLHGVNTDHRRFRFAGADGEPDVRDIAQRAIDAGALPPCVIGAPSTVLSSDFPTSLWPAFDLDRFVELTAERLRGDVRLDLARVVVVGHSGAGCNPRGGVFSAARDTSLALRGVMLVDTCLDVPNAPLLVDLPPSVDVVLTFQTKSWPRPFDDMSAAFLGPRRDRLQRDARATGTIAISEARAPTARHVHNAMVEEAFLAYLPALLAPRRAP